MPIKSRTEALQIARGLRYVNTDKIAARINEVFRPNQRAAALATIPAIVERAQMAGDEYMSGFDKRHAIECKSHGINPWPPSKTERKEISLANRKPKSPRKQENARRKRAQWLANHAARAEQNRAHANDPRHEPSYAGQGRHAGLTRGR